MAADLHEYYRSRWSAFNANVPLKGADAHRKPDLLLPITGSPGGADADWRDIVAFGEVKSKKNTKSEKTSYTEAAGKAAFMLYAQDGRHSAPCIHILGSHIYFTIFDRGGSISTAGFDIHAHPRTFLRILLGISTGSRARLGFDATVRVDSSVHVGEQTRRKCICITLGEAKTYLILDHVIFTTNGLHGRGTTIWQAWLDSDACVDREDWKGIGRKRARETPRKKVAVKDSWIDPLRTYSEGMILDMLHKANVKGVPKLVSEEQVKAHHPSPNVSTAINNSTHHLRTLALKPGASVNNIPYHLRVHSRLVSEPVGSLITTFSCLGELLVVFIDYVTSMS